MLPGPTSPSMAALPLPWARSRPSSSMTSSFRPITLRSTSSPKSSRLSSLPSFSARRKTSSASTTASTCSSSFSCLRRTWRSPRTALLARAGIATARRSTASRTPFPSAESSPRIRWRRARSRACPTTTRSQAAAPPTSSSRVSTLRRPPLAMLRRSLPPVSSTSPRRPRLSRTWSAPQSTTSPTSKREATANVPRRPRITSY
mmetsp:Transcript_47865/g.95570  ORF Transcript_47865/g.95570 Transcript_47865/m.95570 type:complete len:203 (+) Transcript_47865:636-1244(+)